MSVWALLAGALQAGRGRPENSITAAEFSAKTGYSLSHAGNILRCDSRLRPVPYVEKGRRAVCYVPASIER